MNCSTTMDYQEPLTETSGLPRGTGLCKQELDEGISFIQGTERNPVLEYYGLRPLIFIGEIPVHKLWYGMDPDPVDCLVKLRMIVESVGSKG